MGLVFADEPFVPEFELPDFATAGFGAAMRGMSLGGGEDYDAWAEIDATERRNTKIEMLDIAIDCAGGMLLFRLVSWYARAAAPD